MRRALRLDQRVGQRCQSLDDVDDTRRQLVDQWHERVARLGAGEIRRRPAKVRHIVESIEASRRGYLVERDVAEVGVRYDGTKLCERALKLLTAVQLAIEMLFVNLLIC